MQRFKRADGGLLVSAAAVVVCCWARSDEQNSICTLRELGNCKLQALQVENWVTFSVSQVSKLPAFGFRDSLNRTAWFLP